MHTLRMNRSIGNTCPTAPFCAPDGAASNQGAKLLRDYKQGCPNAFTALYKAYEPLVRWRLWATLPRAFYLSEGDDLVQEAFLRLAESSPAFETDLDVTRWLSRIAHNLAISALRKRRLTSNSEIIDQP